MTAFFILKYENEYKLNVHLIGVMSNNAQK